MHSEIREIRGLSYPARGAMGDVSGSPSRQDYGKTAPQGDDRPDQVRDDKGLPGLSACAAKGVSERKTSALQGRRRSAQGASPGKKGSPGTEPCKGGARACFAFTALSQRRWRVAPEFTPRARPSQGLRQAIRRIAGLLRRSRRSGPTQPSG